MADAPSKLHRDAARNIVTKYLKVRPGENAIVESWDHTMPLATAVVDELRRAGGRTLHIQEDEEAWWRAIDRKQAKLLGRSSDPEWAALKATDLYLHFWGPGDTDRLEKLPEKTFDAALGWFDAWYPMARRTGLRGARVTIGFATEGRARQWGLDRASWEEKILRACLTDPAETAKSGARLAKAIAGGRKVRITHANGTDLEVALAGAPPRVHDGTPHPRNKRYGPSDMLSQIPSGRVDIALDAKTAEGSLHANRRTNIWWRWDSGGTYEFAGGKLTSYSFDEGEEEFSRRFRQGTAGKDRTGALMFGLNPAVRDVPNLESVERGAVSLVIGRNGHLNGSNPSNFMSWITLAGAEIAVDGTPVVRDGKLL
jgi:leucyl aminopeptidase (aminopeptidase T)